MSHGTYNFPPMSGQAGSGAPRMQLASTIGLNVHNGPPQPGPPSMMHYHHRPHSRKYDSEPLSGGANSANAGGMRSLGGGINSERFSTLHSPSGGGGGMHSASYMSTSSSSQASSRSQSRASSLSSHSHLPSPRSHSPHSNHAHAHYLSPSTPSSAQQQQQQQQQMMPTPSTISPPLSSRQGHLPSPALLMPQQSQSVNTPISNVASSSSSGASPSTPGSSSCSSCTNVALENAALRASLANQQYELRLIQNACRNELAKMRSDVTKALIAFESRLHLQMQQQLGFKPDLEPMMVNGSGAQIGSGGTNGAGNSSIVAQALTQIQQTLDKFDPSRQLQQQQQQSDDSAWQSKRSSWTAPLTGGAPTSSVSPANGQTILGWPDQQGNGQQQQQSANSPYAGVSPPQLTSSLLSSSSHHSNAPSSSANANINLANLNLGNINNLAQLLSAVSGIQSQMAAAGGQHAHGHQSPSPSMMHHHGNNSGSGGGHHSHSGGSMTEEKLILLAIDILSVHGAVPVGKMGSLLHKAACDHTLPQMLKERYGGLKKFLQSQTHFFTLGTDHPYNPSLSLSAEFLAANPHIRPPEPASALPATTGSSLSGSPAPPDALPGVVPSPPTSSLSTTSSSSASSQPALPAVLDYHRYFGATTGTGSASAAPSLLSPLSSTLPRGVSAPALGLTSGSASDADREHSTNPFLFESDADMERVGHFLSLGNSNVASGSGNAAGSSSASALSGLAADDELSLAWDKHAQDIKAELGHTSGSAPINATETVRGADDEPLALQPVQNSPALGATEASATANETFFSRLLG